MDWNRGPHARKFLRADGQYVSNGTVRSGRFAFWGEWEPQSRVVETFPDSTLGEPGWLHEPLWEVPAHRQLLQNTDPLVYGDQFLYTNCRQGRNSKLRELAPGSIVVFGSKLGGEFVLDTVFVVDGIGERFEQASPGDIRCDDWVRAVVFDPLSRRPRQSPHPFRLYRGRSYGDAQDGPFSFVPCRAYESEKLAFARPAVRLPRRWIEPDLALGAKATPATASDLRELWHRILDGVVGTADLDLGVRLTAPKHLERAAL
jgi:hypothetical protein